MRTIKFAVECLIGILSIVFFYTIFILCAKMHVIISDKNISYMTLQLFIIPIAVIFTVIWWSKKINDRKRAIFRTIIMIIYMANMFCVGETILNTRRMSVLQAAKENPYLKVFMVLYIIFCLIMWGIQVIRMFDALEINRLIDKCLNYLLGDDSDRNKQAY